MNEQVLSNGGVRMACRWEPESAGLMAALEQFLWPWFVRVARAAPSHWRLRLRPARAFPDPWRKACTQALLIRQSSAPLFNLRALSGHSESGALLAWDGLAQVGYHVDQERGDLDFFGDTERGFVHLIELVRYYGLLIEQSRGTLVLHAAAVHALDTQEVLAIVGAKGAGKTTALLSHIATGAYGYFSGDKLLLNLEDGKASVRGWPDYPHLGIGTLRAHPLLARRLGVRMIDTQGRPLPPDQKVLVPPEDFLQAIGPPRLARGRLAGLLLPRVQQRAPAEEQLLSAGDKDAVDPLQLFEWPHRFVTARWHGLPLTQGPHSDHISDAAWAQLKGLPWLRPRNPGLAAASATMELL